MDKRLIDADKFLQWVVKRFKCVPLVGSCDNDAESMRLLLAQAPTVNAAEVIRCRNCIHDGLSTCPMCYIEDKTLVFVNHDPDFYCGKGEHKGGQAPQREDV